MSIDEFMQFALDVMRKTKSSMEEFKTRFVEVKKQWIENRKGNSKLFDEEEEEKQEEEEEEKEEETSAYVNVVDSIDYSQLFPSMYGEMTYAMLRLRYNIDYVKGAKAFELDLLTAPGKPLRSIPRLKEALNEFFEKHQDDPYVTVNELAIAVGYTDGDALSKALFDESNPKYTALLRKAYALVDDALTKRMLYVADKRKDVKGYETALKRMDSKRDKYDPAAMQSDASLKISIDI